MELEQRVRLAVIAGASHALNLKKQKISIYTEDIVQRVASEMSSILKTLGESRFSKDGQILSLGAITGANKAMHIAERDESLSDKEVLRQISNDMGSIIENMKTEQ
jgi:hypothetical protein